MPACKVNSNNLHHHTLADLYSHFITNNRLDFKIMACQGQLQTFVNQCEQQQEYQKWQQQQYLGYQSSFNCQNATPPHFQNNYAYDDNTNGYCKFQNHNRRQIQYESNQNHSRENIIAQQKVGLFTNIIQQIQKQKRNTKQIFTKEKAFNLPQKSYHFYFNNLKSKDTSQKVLPKINSFSNLLNKSNHNRFQSKSENHQNHQNHQNQAQNQIKLLSKIMKENEVSKQQFSIEMDFSFDQIHQKYSHKQIKLNSNQNEQQFSEIKCETKSELKNKVKIGSLQTVKEPHLQQIKEKSIQFLNKDFPVSSQQESKYEYLEATPQIQSKIFEVPVAKMDITSQKEMQIQFDLDINFI